MLQMRIPISHSSRKDGLDSCCRLGSISNEAGSSQWCADLHNSRSKTERWRNGWIRNLLEVKEILAIAKDSTDMPYRGKEHWIEVLGQTKAPYVVSSSQKRTARCWVNAWVSIPRLTIALFHERRCSISK